MPVLLTTDSVAPPDRLDYWQSCLHEQFGIDTRIEPQRGTQFARSAAASVIGPLVLCEHWGSSVSGAKRPSGNEDSLFVWLQTEQTSSVACRGRVASHDGCDDTSSSRMETYHRERIKNFVRANLCNPDLDVRAVAQGVGLSPGHVHRLFSRQDAPLMQWVWTERLRRCYRELANAPAGRSISSIAYAWGFNDAAHFSRAFRECFGVSPRQLRETCAAAGSDGSPTA